MSNDEPQWMDDQRRRNERDTLFVIIFLILFIGASIVGGAYIKYRVQKAVVRDAIIEANKINEQRR